MILIGVYLTVVECNMLKFGFFLCAITLKLVQSITYQLLFHISSSWGPYFAMYTENTKFRVWPGAEASNLFFLVVGFNLSSTCVILIADI